MTNCICPNSQQYVLRCRDDAPLPTLCSWFLAFLLTIHWREACVEDCEKKAADCTWKDGAFASIMREYEKEFRFGQHSVATEDIFHTYLHWGIKKPNNTTPKAFAVCSKVLMKLYKEIDANYYDCTIWGNETKLIFFNVLSADYCNIVVQKPKKYSKWQ